jgi:hypothetical protein
MFAALDSAGSIVSFAFKNKNEDQRRRKFSNHFKGLELI